MEKTPGTEVYDPFLMVGYLFDNMETKICADCPAADVQYASDARNMKCPTKFSKEAGCCSCCSYDMGYFTQDLRFLLGEDSIGDYTKKIRTDVRQKLREMAFDKKEKYGFDDDYGFFDMNNHRCRLPRQERSITCSVFCCDNMEKTLSDSDKDIIGRQKKRMVEKRKEEIGF